MLQHWEILILNLIIAHNMYLFTIIAFLSEQICEKNSSYFAGSGGKSLTGTFQLNLLRYIWVRFLIDDFLYKKSVYTFLNNEVQYCAKAAGHRVR